jgi:Tol biopolymer transport system component
MRVLASVASVALWSATIASAQGMTAASPAILDDEPWVVYNWDTSTAATLFLARPDGSDSHLVLSGMPGLNQWHPDWSPMGDLIAFANEDYGAKDIWLTDPSGAAPRLLYDSPPEMPFVDHPAFSPDGTQLVAGSYDAEPTFDISTRSALILVDVATGDAQEISALEGEHMLFAYPRWSPDGNALVVSIGLYDETDTQWIGEAIGVLRRIDTGWSEPELITEFQGFGSYPDWSPDGDRIIFATRDKGWFINTMTNHGKAVDWGGVTADLYTIRPDGSGLERITDASANGWDAGQPTWTPDGRVIFTYTASHGPRLAFMEADGSGMEVRSTFATHSRLRATP